MPGLLNDLGQRILPSVFSSLNSAGIVDTMTIKAETAATIGTGGGRIKGTPTDAYEAVPVSYEPTQVEKRVVTGDKAVSSLQYTLTFPTHHVGERIDIDPKTHRLIVDARGNEPEKTFQFTGDRDISGVVFEAACVCEGYNECRQYQRKFALPFIRS
jgi:hypothetical protein